MPRPRPTPTLRGDEAALYARHHRALRRAVAHRVATRSPHTVEDACQLAWLRLLRYQPDRATVWPWLLTVAEREAWRLEREGAERFPLTPYPVDVARMDAAAPRPMSPADRHSA